MNTFRDMIVTFRASSMHKKINKRIKYGKVFDEPIYRRSYNFTTVDQNGNKHSILKWIKIDEYSMMKLYSDKFLSLSHIRIYKKISFGIFQLPLYVIPHWLYFWVYKYILRNKFRKQNTLHMKINNEPMEIDKRKIRNLLHHIAKEDQQTLQKYSDERGEFKPEYWLDADNVSSVPQSQQRMISTHEQI